MSSHDDNNALGIIIRNGRTAQAQLDNADNLPVHTRAYLEAAVRDGNGAVDELWELNRGLSINFTRQARQFHRPSSRYDLEDLQQTCDLILLEACRRWDPDGGKTLAGWYYLLCRRRLRSEFAAVDGTLTYTTNAFELATRAAAIIGRHRAETGLPDHIDEDAIRDELPPMSDAMWDNVLASLNDHPTRLDNPSIDGDATSGPLYETIADADVDLADDVAEAIDGVGDDTEVRRLLLEAVYDLPEPWRTVAILRSGIEDGQRRLLHDIGDIHGFSRERARKVWNEALAHLRGDIDLHLKARR